MKLTRKSALLILLALFAWFPTHSIASAMTQSTQFGIKFIRVELYFGLSKPDGSSITDDELRTFVDNEVTPRFADGFTVIDAWGQFRDRDGRIIREQSRVLIVMYRKSDKKKCGAMIDEIRAAYKKAFDQESVMRVDYPKNLEVDF